MLMAGADIQSHARADRTHPLCPPACKGHAPPSEGGWEAIPKSSLIVGPLAGNYAIWRAHNGYMHQPFKREDGVVLPVYMWNEASRAPRRVRRI